MAPEPWKILVVDDVEGLRRLVTIVLEQNETYEVVGEAASGEEALNLTDETDPDVVLLDLSMPGMDGFETLERLRQQDGSVHVIVLSGHETRDMATRAAEQGALAFIEKGQNPQDLVKELDKALEGASRGS